MTLAGPYVAGCLLLMLGGAAKAARPPDAARAIAVLAPAVPLRAGVVVVRLVAAGEVALGAAALVFPAPPLAAAVAASYLAFAAVVLVVRRRGGPLATCGCFGTPDTPATRVHVGVNLALTVAAAVVAAVPPPERAWGELATSPLGGIPLLVVAALVAWLAVLALGPLARLGAARHPRSGDGTVQAPRSAR